MTIECTGYREHASGVLQGFANFRMKAMMPPCELFGCAIFSKNGRRWISMPSREYVDPETREKKYISVFRFVEKAHNEVWCKAALNALDEWCKQNVQQTDTHETANAEQEEPNDGLPF